MLVADYKCFTRFRLGQTANWQNSCKPYSVGRDEVHISEQIKPHEKDYLCSPVAD